MRSTLLSFGLIASVVIVGCGDDSSTGSGGAGGSGGSGTTSSTTATTATTSDTTSTTGSVTSTTSGGGSSADGGTGGGAPSCAGAFEDPTCSECAEGICCTETSACLASDDCVACLAGDDAACEAAGQIATDITTCLTDFCSAECTAQAPACDAPEVAVSGGACVAIGGAFECNPVTQEGCDFANGEACDFNETGFTCYPPPNDEALCAECDGNNGLFCAPSFTCFNLKCARYCCDDSDCGTGTCQPQDYLPSQDIGVCVE